MQIPPGSLQATHRLDEVVISVEVCVYDLYRVFRACVLAELLSYCLDYRQGWSLGEGAAHLLAISPPLL